MCVAAVILSAVACGVVEEENNLPIDNPFEGKEGVFCHFAPIESEEPATKGVDFDSYDIVTFDENDQITIWSESKTALFYTLTDIIGSYATAAYFDGGGFKLTSGMRYTSLYPAMATLKYEEVPMSYLGQVQSESNNSAHLKDYLYYWAEAYCYGGHTEFDYHTKSGFLQLNLTFPEETTITTVKLIADTNVFDTAPTLNAGTGEVTNGTLTNEISIALGASGFHVAKDGQIVVYMAAAPFASTKMYIQAFDNAGNEFTSKRGQISALNANVKNTINATMGSHNIIIDSSLDETTDLDFAGDLHVTIIKSTDDTEEVMNINATKANTYPDNVYITVSDECTLGNTTLNINMPNTHVEIDAAAAQNIKEINTTTSINTLVLSNKITVGDLTVKGGSLDLSAPVTNLTIDIPSTQVNETEDMVDITVKSTVTNLTVTRAATEELPDKIFVTIDAGASVTETLDVDETNCNLYVAPTATVATVETAAQENTISGTVNTLTASGENTTISGTVGTLTASGANTLVVVEKQGAVTDAITSQDDASVVIVERTDSEIAAQEAGVIPVEANQTEDGGTISTIVGDVVAVIGQASYSSLTAAIEAADSNATIKVMKDLTLTSGFTIDKSLVIDLNGKTITANAASNSDSNFPNNRLFKVTGTASLTLENGTTVLNDKLWGSIRFESTGNLVLTNYITYNSREWGANIKMSHGNATLTNVSIYSDKGGCVDIGDGSYDAPSGAVAVMTNCTFEQTGVGSTEEYKTVSSAVIVSCSGHATLNSGTYSGYYGLFPHSSGGTITVKEGCTVTGTHNAVHTVNLSSTYINTQEDHLIYIEGGTINGTFDVANDGHTTFSVTGGTFDHDPSAYVAAGYEAVKSGKVWTVQNAGYAARIDDTPYVTLAEAIAAANDAGNVTITLLCDYDFEANEPGYGWTTAYLAEGETETRDNMLEISGNNITFELAGHTISNLFNNTFKVSGTNVTFQNGEMRVGQLYYSNAAGTKIYTSENDKTCSYIMLVAGATNFVVNNLTTYGGINVCEGSTATINDLSFSGTKFYAVCSQENSTVTLNGGTYTKAITGATGHLFWIEAGSKMNITGGTFIKGNAAFRNGNVNPVITGGTFDFDPTNFGVAAGYEATQSENVWTVAEIQDVAQIGSVRYATLAAAVEAAEDGQDVTIEILRDFTIEGNAGVTIPADKIITIDLKGKNVKNLVTADAQSQLILNNGTLTITDSSNTPGSLFNEIADGVHPGSWTDYNYSTSIIYNTGTVTVQNGTIRQVAGGGSSNICFAIDNVGANTSLTVNGGTLQSGYIPVRSYIGQNKSVAIHGGTLTGLYDIYLQSNTTLNIDGGTFNAPERNIIYVDGASTVNISGNAVFNHAASRQFIAFDSDAVQTGSNVSVTGGTFNSNPATFVASGYEATQSENVWTVAEIQDVAQIGSVRYATLAAAVEAAEDGQDVTIEILRDFTIEGNAGVTIPAGKSITLDLNGKTIKNLVTEDKASQLISNKGTLTITDSSAGANGTMTNEIADGVHTGAWTGYNYSTSIISNAGTLIIENGNINQVATTNISYAIDNLGANTSTTVNGGNLVAGYIPIRSFNGQNKSVAIHGGTLTGLFALYLQSTTTLTIDSGTFNAPTRDAIYVEEASTITISNKQDSKPVFNYATGRKFVAFDNNSAQTGSTVNVYAGQYSSDPTEFLTGNYVAEQEDDVWVVYYHIEGTAEGPTNTPGLGPQIPMP